MTCEEEQVNGKDTSSNDMLTISARHLALVQLNYPRILSTPPRMVFAKRIFNYTLPTGKRNILFNIA